MAFTDIFKNSSDYNEKTIIGFMSFAIMAITAIADVTTGLFGFKLVIHEFVYNAFVTLTLGSFGVAGLESFSPAAKVKAESHVKQAEHAAGLPDPE